MLKASGLISVCLIMVLLVACQAPLKRETTPSDYIVRKGETFKIELKANPTTGYHWVIVHNDHRNLTDSISDVYTADQSKKTAIAGGGGEQTFEFKAQAKGLDTLNFIYMRPWEVGAVPCDKASFVIEIR